MNVPQSVRSYVDSADRIMGDEGFNPFTDLTVVTPGNIDDIIRDGVTHVTIGPEIHEGEIVKVLKGGHIRVLEYTGERALNFPNFHVDFVKGNINISLYYGDIGPKRKCRGGVEKQVQRRSDTKDHLLRTKDIVHLRSEIDQLRSEYARHNRTITIDYPTEVKYLRGQLSSLETRMDVLRDQLAITTSQNKLTAMDVDMLKNSARETQAPQICNLL